MSFVADLHVHSHFSRATSRDCTLEGFHRWAQIKGVRVVGTGDFTHPVWSDELRDKLEPAEPGLFRLKNEFVRAIDDKLPARCRGRVSFMISGEISSIYTRDGRCRKVHTLVFCPDFATMQVIRSKLDAIGNINSDGRPILGLDPRHLLEIVLEANPSAFVVPAHIWTPWFSVLGSKSGFDSIQACFSDLTPFVFAVETGLSSDPQMNRRVPVLDAFTLMANSDLHSPSKMARNATVFTCDVDFFAMRQSLQDGQSKGLGGTIDLFPEEGKYFLDGHRKCGFSSDPRVATDHQGLCPVCGKPMVLGVLHRVEELAGSPATDRQATQALPLFESIIPLTEILSELLSCGSTTKKVNRAYDSLIQTHGSELAILRTVEPNDLRTSDIPHLDEAIARLRNRQVIRQGGYDGKYGTIRLFEADELA